MKNTLLVLFLLIIVKCYSQSDTSNLSKNNSEEIFTVVEEMPEFIGGKLELSKFITANLKTPKVSKDVGLSGKCFLKFIIDSNGNIKDISILKGVPNCIECDNEAVRVIKLMPKWKAGKQNGKNVAVFYNQVINFQFR